MTAATARTEIAEPAPARRIALLVNPAAGRSDDRAAARLAARLREAGAHVDLIVGAEPGDLAAAVADLDVDTVAVAGGDGTINDVIGALVARSGPHPRLAVVPQGTANVLAHEYRLPRDVAGIAAAILAERTRPLHLGLATDAAGLRRPFFLMTSAGIDAAVVHTVEGRPNTHFKKPVFVVAALRHGMRRRPDVMVTATTATGEILRFRAALAIVSKASHYGGPFVLTRETAMDRPGLRLVAVKHGSVLALAAAALRLALGRLEGSSNVVSQSVSRVRLSTMTRIEEVPVQIDGEPWGRTAVDVTALDTAVDLVVA